MNPRKLTGVIGVLLLMLGTVQLLPAFLQDSYSKIFISNAIACMVMGGGMLLIKQPVVQLSTQEAVTIALFSWIITITVFIPPLMIHPLTKLSFVDALFEATSGVTATGSTVFATPEALTKDILLWRMLTHLMGGAGIIMTVVNILPKMQIGGMQLFSVESSREDSVLKNHVNAANATLRTYIVLILSSCTAYKIVGMDWFDAICHAISTISTGGFSNHSTSIAHFNNRTLEIVVSIFMILSSLPLLIYAKAVHQSPKEIINEQQIVLFAIILTIATICTAAWMFEHHLSIKLLTDHQITATIQNSITQSLFNVSSIMSSTGFVTSDLAQWGSFPVVIMIIVACVGGCTGSTSGGIKALRITVMLQVIKLKVLTSINPNRIIVAKYNSKPLTDKIIISLMAYIATFVITLTISTAILAATGLDGLSSISASVAAITNSGEAMGNSVGPAADYRALPTAVKYTLILTMLLGRLEFYTVLAILSRDFWRSNKSIQ